MPILPRYYSNDCSYNNGYYNNCYNSPWDSYGRWILLAAIIVGSFFIFLMFACITARRRRRAGMQPYRFTGWAGGNVPPGHAPAQYNANQQAYQQNPPVYSQQQPGYGQQQGAAQGYFGGQQSGVEMQHPNNTYQPNRAMDADYTAPAGPPPGKHDGIVR